MGLWEVDAECISLYIFPIYRDTSTLLARISIVGSKRRKKSKK